MKFSLVSLFPEMLEQALQWGVVGKAFEKKLASYELIDPRAFTEDVHRTVDDRPYGGGDGMVMLYEPLAKAMASIEGLEQAQRIYLSPKGRLLDESLVQDLSQKSSFVLLCGRYGGVDQRVLNQYDFQEISVGDYVVSGGELPALTLVDALLRQCPGVLGHQDSAANDSLAQGQGFEAPLFSRPQVTEGGVVPAVLTNGDHKKIAEFRRLVGLALTNMARPQLVHLSLEDKKKIVQLLREMPADELRAVGLDQYQVWSEANEKS